ncbi:cytochrome o ubiquinol oxidase subunit IV [Pseudomonas alliivorans]|nr:cytochrome o ubiquinol oxidase subunit IV [Pseudomonas alliivorans]
MYTQSPVRSTAGTSLGNNRSYLVGFILSVVLTLIPFSLAMYPALPRITTVWLVVLTGMIQVVVHLKFFLHLDTAVEQRWNLRALIFSAVIIVLLVGLTLWIMFSIQHNMLAH